MADRPAARRCVRPAILYRRDDGAGDAVRDGGRRLRRHRLHADGAGRILRGAHRRRPAWPAPRADASDAPLRPWLLDPLGDAAAGRGDGIGAITGPNLAVLRAAVPLHGEDFSTTAEFTVAPEDRFPFVLSYGPSHRPPPDAIDAEAALCDTLAFCALWSKHCTCHGRWRKVVMRSLLTLKALTYAETGGIVAAPTTSSRRSSVVSATGITASAGCATRRAHSGRADARQLLRGSEGVARLAAALGRRQPSDHPDHRTGSLASGAWPEWEVPWLPGYQRSRRRSGSAMPPRPAPARCLGRGHGCAAPRARWRSRFAGLGLGAGHAVPCGIWRRSGGNRMTASGKCGAAAANSPTPRSWPVVAFDRMIRDAEKYGFEAPLERWRATQGRDPSDGVRIGI